MAPLPVLYDADCGFCRWSLAWLLRSDRHGRLLPVALGTPDADALLAALTEGERAARAHVVTPDGVVHSGGDAVAPITSVLTGPRAAAAARMLAAPLRFGYDAVARNRSTLSRLVPGAAELRATAAIERHRRRVAT